VTGAGPAPELHRPLAVARIAADGPPVTIEADPAECAALAARLRLPAILGLTCRYVLTRRGRSVVDATGRLHARVTQTCVVSLDAFDAAIDESFSVRFVPAGTEQDDPDPESIDEIPYEGDAIDLGEATAEQLALALDPYPRRPGAALPEDAEVADPRLAGLAAWARDPARDPGQ
jgi:hypothetical protein